MQKRKLLAGAVIGLGSFALGAAGAGAGHTHSLQTGNGSCVLLAADGGEDQVQLPFADVLPANRQHPLHVLVHTGEAGSHLSIGVAGAATDPCGTAADYLND